MAKVLLVLGHICSIPILVVIVQNKGRADSIRWNAFESTTTTYEVNKLTGRTKNRRLHRSTKIRLSGRKLKTLMILQTNPTKLSGKKSQKSRVTYRRRIAEQSTPYSIKPVGNHPHPFRLWIAQLPSKMVLLAQTLVGIFPTDSVGQNAGQGVFPYLEEIPHPSYITTSFSYTTGALA